MFELIEETFDGIALFVKSVAEDWRFEAILLKASMAFSSAFIAIFMSIAMLVHLSLPTIMHGPGMS
jgi:hypothetical protein